MATKMKRCVDGRSAYVAHFLILPVHHLDRTACTLVLFPTSMVSATFLLRTPAISAVNDVMQRYDQISVSTILEVKQFLNNNYYGDKILNLVFQIFDIIGRMLGRS